MNKSETPWIDKNEWIKDQFALALDLTDMLRIPDTNYPALSPQEQNKVRQSQVTSDEVIQVLGQHSEFYLIKKWDNVVGWIHVNSVKLLTGIHEILAPKSENLSVIDFFVEWTGTPYKWGGITKDGIDCSGFTQRYYLDVHNLKIPKNSKDQRKLGKPIAISEIEDHDLVFCHRKGGTGIHHVGVYFSGTILHSQLVRGVVLDDLEDFLDKHTLEEVVRIIE